MKYESDPHRKSIIKSTATTSKNARTLMPEDICSLGLESFAALPFLKITIPPS